MQRVRAKVSVQGVTPFDTHSPEGRPVRGATVVMTAVVAGEGNRSWAAATPSAQFSMSVTNPDAVALFEPGAELYVDFTRA